MDDRGVRRGSWVYPIKEDPDHKGAGCSGPAVQAGSGLTVPGLAEVASCRSHPLGTIVSKVPQVTFAFWIIKILATTSGKPAATP